MSTIKDKIDRRLNDTFTENLRAFLKKKFPDVTFESHFNICSMRMVTEWDTEDPVKCGEIKKFAEAYEAAYSRARQEIWNA
jgi:hypothetical protein